MVDLGYHSSPATTVEAQQALLNAARADGGMLPTALARIEAHGTGTALGDPIEARSLAAAVLAPSVAAARGGGGAAGVPAVGSLKANVGHGEPAAGASGLLSLSLSLRACEAPPNAQLRRLNAHVGAAVSGVACALPE